MQQWCLWGITTRGESHCEEISTCHVPTEVLSAQIVEARVMFPQGWQLWVRVPCQALAYHAEHTPPPQPTASPTACRGAQWQLLFTGYLPHFLIFILAGHHRATGGVLPPLMSLLRGGSGKTISGEYLDHLFRAPGVSRKPNCPHLFARVLSSRLSLQVGHECELWKVHQAGCQRASSQTNTNATRRSFCE